MATEKIIAIVPAGGVGSRAQRVGAMSEPLPKQYQCIAGKTMLEHSVLALLAHKGIEQVHIAVSEHDQWIGQLNFPPRCFVHKTGGESRAHTVLNTLTALSLDQECWVMVHDAARPGLPLEPLTALIQLCLEKQQGGILALPVGDTVKRACLTTSPLCVESTLPREGLWLAQTPQLFKGQRLRYALTTALANHFNVTDEASAMEYIGDMVLLMSGHWKNIKVTWQEDFEFMEKCL